MTLLRSGVIAGLVMMAGSASPTHAAPPEARFAHAEVQHKGHQALPRVEIGEAILTIYDDSGRVISVE